MRNLQFLNKSINAFFKKNSSFCNSNRNFINFNANIRKPICSIHTDCSLLSAHEENKLSLVYEGPLKKRIKIVKLLSLSSSMLGFAILPIVVKDMYQINFFLAGTVSLVSTAFLSTPLLLHFITKRYVIKLNFDKETETFRANTYNLIGQETEIKFGSTDVTVPDVPGMLTSFKVKNRPLFVDANLVKDPDAYSIMMGYDKPFDFKLESEKEEEKTQS